MPIYVTYFRKGDLKYIIDKPIKYSEVSKDRNRQEVAKYLLDRCNELGKMFLDEKLVA